MSLEPPVVYFGRKPPHAARLVWDALGRDAAHYVEPFCGALGVLLHVPYVDGRTETINDYNCWVTNFWRAMKYAPNDLAVACCEPVVTLDMHAWAHAMQRRSAVMRDVLIRSPGLFDLPAAAAWAMGRSQCIGSDMENLGYSVPALGDRGRGVKAVPRRDDLRAQFDVLSRRMRHVRIHCGDWTSVLTSAVIGASSAWANHPVAVFLDPPYDKEERMGDVYGGTRGVAGATEAWCLENGHRENMRIVLAGYRGHYDLPGWGQVSWAQSGGYSDAGQNEMLWLSPGCAAARVQHSLFGGSQ